MDIMVIYNMISELACVTVSETTPKDHLIVLHEFLLGNKAHTMSSSIRKLFDSMSKLFTSQCKVTSELYYVYMP